MAHPDVMAAVAARFSAGFTEPDCLIREGNDPTDGDRTRTAFVTLQFPYSTSYPATVGAPGGQWWGEEGAFRFVITLPRGSKLDRGAAWAERIASLFRGEEFDEVVCFAPGSPVTDDRNDTGAFFRLSFSVPYEFQFQKVE